jgi:iron complex outermembrane recepter protein
VFGSLHPVARSECSGAMIRRIVISALALPALTAEEALDPQADQLPLVTITSTKVKSDPVTVPASVAVVTGTQIIEAGHLSIDDVAASTAGVHFMNLGTHTTYPVIRGMFGLEVDAPTGYYIDGVAQRGLGADQLVDVERVEILRGPQGTLYGRNSVPGIVNVVTRDPGADWSGYSIMDGAQRRTFGLTAAAGGPIGNGVGIRLAAHGQRSDPVITNTAPNSTDDPGKRDSTLQGKVRWSSSDAWTTVTLSGIRNRFYASGDHFAPVNEALHHRTNNDHLGSFDRQLDSWGLTITQDVAEDVVLTSITSTTRNNDIFDLDQDFSEIDDKTYVRDTYAYELGQEVRISGGEGLRSWVIGIYGSSGRESVLQDTVLKRSFITKDTDVERTSRNLSLFGQVGIPLGEQLTLTLGLRGNLDRESVDVVSRATANPPGFLPPPVIAAINGTAAIANFDYQDQRNFYALLPKASLSWSWNKTSFSYATISRGYHGGGYNKTPWTEKDVAGGYESEFATVYEIGHRATMFDRRLSINAAAYHTDYTNKQSLILDSPQYYFVNAGRVSIDGGELEINAKPAPALDTFANLGIVHSRITEYGGPLVGSQGNPLEDLKGNQLAMAPSFDAAIGTQWRHPWGVFIRPEVQFIGRYFADNNNNISQDPHQILNLRLGYEWERAGVYLWGKNLGQAHYLTRGSTTSLTGDERLIGVAGSPRTIGASAQVEF